MNQLRTRQLQPACILHLRLPSEAEGIRSSRLESFCTDITPRWGQAPDGIWLDLTGSQRLYGWGPDGPAFVFGQASRRFAVLAGGAGANPTLARLGAWLAARLQPGSLLFVPPGSGPAFLAPLPVDILEEQTALVSRLKQLGVRTLGDLQVVPEALLRAVVGRPAAEALALAVAGAPEPVGSRWDRAARRFRLVAGARFGRPVLAENALSALRSALALRALGFCPAGPGAYAAWELRVFRPGRSVRVTVTPGPVAPSLSAWRRLLERLWLRLPRSRTGVVGAELLAGPFLGGNGVRELDFPGAGRDRLLAEALARINGPGSATVHPAGEKLLAAWGVTWYSRHRPAVDAGPTDK